MTIYYRAINATFKKHSGPSKADISIHFDLKDNGGLTLDHWLDRVRACLKLEISTHYEEYYLFYFVIMEPVIRLEDI